MVNNSPNIIKMYNHTSPPIIVCKKETMTYHDHDRDVGNLDPGFVGSQNRDWVELVSGTTTLLIIRT